MRIKSFLFGLYILTALSCGSQNSRKQEMLNIIEKKEKSIKDISIDLRPGQSIPMSESDELVTLLLDFYEAFPDSKHAPACLDKIHMIYSSTKRYPLSAEYGNILLLNYPEYINRAMIIESMAVTYDLFIQPRNKEKVRMYNELLLKENPDLSQEKKEEIQFKLDNLDLTLEEIIKKSSE